MVVTDPTREGASASAMRWRTRRLPRITLPGMEPALPLLLAAAAVAGLAIVVLAMPIAGRGDYGQWLMASRHYLGLEVPDYRSVAELPPLVPALLAAVQVLVPDPVVAITIFHGLLLLGVGIGFYLVGTLVHESRWVGVFSIVIGLLVTDRVLELFAFGGLLQAASLFWMLLGVAGFARASRESRVALRWWSLGIASMGLAALTHVGTGAIAVPTGFATGSLAAFSLRRLGWRTLTLGLLPLLLPLVGVAAYWFAVLLPASGDYVTNPASLAYRGPDRLFAGLFSYWPTTVVAGLGAASLVIGAFGDLRRRQVGGSLFLLVWVAATWGALAYSMTTAAATDYPRFATLLLAPLAVAASGGVVWLLGRFTAVMPRLTGTALTAGALMLVVVVASSQAVGRYERQVSVYAARDAAALTAAVLFVDQAMAVSRQSVLTDVRDGKWLEGLTGREALFSQPVRYAFRPAEWERSVDADALLRSTDTLTSGYVSAHFGDFAADGELNVPTALLLSVNHGGEFVDVLRAAPSALEILVADGDVSAASLVPVDVSRTATSRKASIRTAWGRRGDATFSFVQTVTAWQHGTTLQLVDHSPGNRLATELAPPLGMAITSLDISGRRATLCFTRIGRTQPCLRLYAAQSDAMLAATDDGGLLVTTRHSDRLDLFVTALTAGEAPVGLALLHPPDLVESHDVGAALIYADDPAYPLRARRLAALGFGEAMAFGPYRVLLREEPSEP